MRIQVKELVSGRDIEKGDTLLIASDVKGWEMKSAKVKKVKRSQTDGVEVILDMRKNIYFSVGMYLEGKSWVKDVKIVTRHEDTD